MKLTSKEINKFLKIKKYKSFYNNKRIIELNIVIAENKDDAIKFFKNHNVI